MKIVLTQDVRNVGQIGDVADVAPGYARNYLIPRKLAEAASAGIIRSLDFQKRLERNKDIRDRKEAETLARGLQGATVTIGAKVGAQNRIHGQITTQDIADAIKAKLGLEVDRHKIEIEQPIRSLGMYLIPMRLAKGLEASITLEVAEESELAAQAQEEASAEAALEAASAEAAEALEGRS